VHRPPATEWLVVASRVKSQCSDQLAVLGGDADVRTGDEESDLAVLVGCTDGDVTESVTSKSRF
jgi:hypothetical protein